MQSLEELNRWSGIIIGAAIEVHRELGPGLLESAYEACLKFELIQRGLQVADQRELPVVYKGLHVECGYRLDLVVEEAIIVELKSVDRLEKIHTAQVMSYLKLSGRHLALLINFNVVVLKDDLKRIVCDLPD